MKGCLIFFTTIASFLVLYIIYLFTAFGVFDKLYTRPEMVAHYDDHEAAFTQAETRIDQITGEATISIEFDGKDVEIFHTNYQGAYHSNWPHGDKEVSDSIAGSIGLDKQSLDRIRDLIESTDCIGYTNMRNTTRTFDFRRSGFGMYSFVRFDQPIPDSLVSSYNDSCHYNLYTRQVVFEYGGGAIGPDCFGDYFFSGE